MPLISKIPGQLSLQDWNEITFSCCQLFTAPPDICKGLSLYFTELITLSTVNVQSTQAHSALSPPPHALGAAMKDSIKKITVLQSSVDSKQALLIVYNQ